MVLESGLRQYLTGSASAYCFDIDTLRASRTEWLSAPEHHRYVRVLDWKVSRGSVKRGWGQDRMAYKCKQEKGVQFIFKSCERYYPDGPISVTVYSFDDEMKSAYS